MRYSQSQTHDSRVTTDKDSFHAIASTELTVDTLITDNASRSCFRKFLQPLGFVSVLRTISVCTFKILNLARWLSTEEIKTLFVQSLVVTSYNQKETRTQSHWLFLCAFAYFEEQIEKPGPQWICGVRQLAMELPQPPEAYHCTIIAPLYCSDDC